MLRTAQLDHTLIHGNFKIRIRHGSLSPLVLGGNSSRTSVRLEDLTRLRSHSTTDSSVVQQRKRLDPENGDLRWPYYSHCSQFVNNTDASETSISGDNNGSLGLGNSKRTADERCQIGREPESVRPTIGHDGREPERAHCHNRHARWMLIPHVRLARGSLIDSAVSQCRKTSSSSAAVCPHIWRR